MSNENTNAWLALVDRVESDNPAPLEWWRDYYKRELERLRGDDDGDA